jgi:hypothetical protein
MELAKDSAKMIDSFISSGKNSGYPGISNGDLLNGQKIYNSMKNKNGPLYNIFGSDALGYITYGLYKSASNKVYVMTYSFPAYSFTSFVEIDNERWFNTD